jgi:PAS domain S-box-containing protein
VPEGLVGTPIGTIMPRDDARTLEGLTRFLSSGFQLEESETREIDAEGNVRYFTNGFTGILEDGCLVRIWGSRRDVTERRQVEREMRLLAQTITSTKDCVWITDLDERILFVNTAFVGTYGYAEEELLGKPLGVLHSPMMPPEVPRQILPATLHGGWYGEVLHRRKDGTEFPLELWTSVVKNDEAEPVALVGVARDISDRKRMEEALRQSEARLRRIADAMRDVVMQLDADGIVQYISHSVEQVLGYRPDETLGRSLFERVHPEEREKVAAMFQHAMRGKDGVTLEFRYQHAAGHLLWLEAVGNVLLDEDRAVVGAVLGVRDVSERKKADDQIRASLREKEVMLKEIHHRVKNNLQVISSLLDLQARAARDPGTARLLRESKDRVRSMSLIHEKLYMDGNTEGVRFSEYVKDLTARLCHSFSCTEETIGVELDVEDMTLDMDTSVPLGIIINELLTNALKYAHPDGGKGRLRVSLRSAEGRMLLLTVCDDGVGFPANVDYRSPSTLGLRIVNTLLSQLHGTLELEKGEGTTFTLRFPRP